MINPPASLQQIRKSTSDHSTFWPVENDKKKLYFKSTSEHGTAGQLKITKKFYFKSTSDHGTAGQLKITKKFLF